MKPRVEEKPIRAPWQTPEPKDAPVGQLKVPRTERCAKCGWQVTSDVPHLDYFWQYRTDIVQPSNGQWLCCFCSRNLRLLIRPIRFFTLVFERAFWVRRKWFKG